MKTIKLLAFFAVGFGVLAIGSVGAGVGNAPVQLPPPGAVVSSTAIPTTLVLLAYRVATANTYVAAVEASTYTTTIILGAQPNGYSGDATHLTKPEAAAVAHVTFD